MKELTITWKEETPEAKFIAAAIERLPGEIVSQQVYNCLPDLKK